MSQGISQPLWGIGNSLRNLDSQGAVDPNKTIAVKHLWSEVRNNKRLDYGLQNCINCLIQLEINLQLVRLADRIEWPIKAK